MTTYKITYTNPHDGSTQVRVSGYATYDEADQARVRLEREDAADYNHLSVEEAD